ncbi:hypothetical protein KC19_VG159700 [Ceratodon purpureus]|uniref:Uncharacterized protein n=1 Tax=Ceratodon purpureus TaxID=3225 RepID=A0A8T0HR64_CERPU|nr:hypothetical protein KC19_VG159700 [Ceratodon purpureus]
MRLDVIDYSLLAIAPDERNIPSAIRYVRFDTFMECHTELWLSRVRFLATKEGSLHSPYFGKSSQRRGSNAGLHQHKDLRRLLMDSDNMLLYLESHVIGYQRVSDKVRNNLMSYSDLMSW